MHAGLGRSNDELEVELACGFKLYKLYTLDSRMRENDGLAGLRQSFLRL